MAFLHVAAMKPILRYQHWCDIYVNHRFITVDMNVCAAVRSAEQEVGELFSYFVFRIETLYIKPWNWISFSNEWTRRKSPNQPIPECIGAAEATVSTTERKAKQFSGKRRTLKTEPETLLLLMIKTGKVFLIPLI